eukprot:TRINITY_DN42415_c0_g1_i2.p1 TRINITY_DN42415_c0_g1~~TRINITY_DN42415_c0_g1_i2.p1  ORF type:complete len:162 (-),score=24.34 TRINITY_DN42415_c0_g1_i2:352-837(-)
MPKVGTKFRVVHKFGGRRKKRKTAVQSTEKPEHQLTKKASATSAGALPTATDTDGNVPSTSSGLHSTVASKRKLSLFESQKSSSGSDSDSDSSEEQVTMEEGAEIDTPTQDMNVIVNLGCLQSIISTLPCPECNQTVSRNTFLSKLGRVDERLMDVFVEWV